MATAETVVRSIFMCIFVILAIVGNIFICLAIRTKKNLQTLTNYYVFNLAVADLAFGLTGMPMILVTSFAGKWILGDALCQISGLLITLFCLVSIWSLTLISINRYIAVGRASSYKHIFRKKRVLVSIGLVWLFAILMAFPPLVGWSRIIPGDNFCTIDGRKHLSYAATIIVLAYFAPLVIMAALYTKIFFVLREHEQFMREMKMRNRNMSFTTSQQDYQDSSFSSEYDSTLTRSTESRKHSSLPRDTKGIKSHNGQEVKQDDVEVETGNGDIGQVNGSHNGEENDNVPGDVDFSNLKDTTAMTERNRVSIISDYFSSENEENNDKTEQADPRDRTISETEIHVVAGKDQNGEPSILYKAIPEKSDSVNSTPTHTVNKVSGSVKLKKTLSGLSHAIKLKKRRHSKKIRRFLREAKITKMLFIVVAAFFICWTPLVVGSILYAFNITPQNFDIMNFGITIACMNSMCNVLIYALMNKLFRSAFTEILYSLKATFKKCFRCKKD